MADTLHVAAREIESKQTCNTSSHTILDTQNLLSFHFLRTICTRRCVVWVRVCQSEQPHTQYSQIHIRRTRNNFPAPEWSWPQFIFVFILLLFKLKLHFLDKKSERKRSKAKEKNLYAAKRANCVRVSAKQTKYTHSSSRSRSSSGSNQ